MRLPWLFLLGTILWGCAPKSNPGTLRNVLSYPMVARTVTFDPGKVEDPDSMSIVQQVYEGLVALNEESQVAPCLASKWEVLPDGRTYVFHLRRNVTFSNGKLLTAADFKRCLERNCTPALASHTARRFVSDIDGAQELLAGKSKELAGVKVIDAQTLQITTGGPCAYFLQKLVLPVAAVYDLQALGDPSKEISKIHEMVGTGPFKVTSVDRQEGVALVANDLYREGRPRLDRIERPYVPEAATRLAMYRSGSLNNLRVERQDLARLEADPALSKQIHYFRRPALWYFGINCSVTPGFDKVQVRQALAMAINRHRIVSEILQGANPAAHGILPPDIFGHRDSAKLFPYDPETARKLLKLAGYPGGKGLPEMVIWYRANKPDMRLFAQAVGQDLERNLGLKVSFKAADPAQMLAASSAKKVPFAATRWSADYLDPQDFLSVLLGSESTANFLDYRSRKFDDLCEEADRNTDPRARSSLYTRAEDLALHDAAIVPICFERDAELIAPQVHGIRNTLVGHMPNSQVSIR